MTTDQAESVPADPMSAEPGSPAPPTPAAEPAAPTDRRWAALALLGVVQFMIVIDNTIVNVALPSIKQALGFSEAGLTWVVNGYAIAAAGLVMLSGRIADLRGRRRMFQLGTAVFTAASLCSGLAWNQGALLAGRFAQGVGEALAGSAAFSIVALLFPEGKERAKAFGIWGGLAGFGAGVGVIASGLLTELAGWRWIFLINILPGIVAVLLVRRLIVESRASGEERQRLDFVSAIFLVAAVGGSVQALLAVTQAPFTSARVLAPIGVGAIALAVFLVLQAVKAEPLVPLRFFTNRVRVSGYLTMLFLLGSSSAVFFLLAVFMQQVLGYSPIQNGLAWLPFCAAFMPGLMASFRLTGRFGYRTTLIAGLGIAAAGVALLSEAAPGGGFATQLLPGLVITAFGFGMANPALGQSVMHGVTEQDAGLASGVSGTVSQLSGVLGLAVFVSVALGVTRAGGAARHLTASGFHSAFVSAAVCLAAGAVLAAVALPGRTATETAEG